MADNTPLMTQYNKIKSSYKDSILLFRLGDFYETFNEDARIVAKVLNITLTSRDKKKDKTPLAGFPYHALDNYVPKLIKNGFTVVIADQVEDARFAKGIIKRSVTRVITPGTVYESSILDSSKNNYLASVYKTKNNYFFSYTDVSTGEIYFTENLSQKELDLEIGRLKPSELLVEAGFLEIDNEGFLIQPIDKKKFEYNLNANIIKDLYNVHSLKSLDIQEDSASCIGLGVLISYIESHQFIKPSHLLKPKRYNVYENMVLDEIAIKSLELLPEQGKGLSLFEVLNETQTPMGTRQLRNLIIKPYLDVDRIRNSYDKVEFFLKGQYYKEIRKKLARILDLARLSSKLGLKHVNPADLINLAGSLAESVEIIKTCKLFEAKHIQKNYNSIEEFCNKISKVLLVTGEGDNRHVINPEFNQEAKKLFKILGTNKQILKKYKEELSREFKIPSLKLGYNKIWGYYIEVTKANVDKVPKSFLPKQTLVNCTRYITERLKNIETEFLVAKEKLSILENQIFNNLVEELIPHISDVLAISSIISEIDVTSNFAFLASRYNYIRPVVYGFNQKSKLLSVKNGKHPVLYNILGTKFVPNSVKFNNDNLIHIITGPNMSGKSTYIRQMALLVIMAQMGCFVPAEKMEFSLVDRIFTRITSSDDISMGMSTFMIEMSEIANILENATEYSLLILDEVGRGTSTYDGLSIAWAITEYISTNLQSKTFFATHYHELTEIEKKYTNCKNYTVLVKEDKEKDQIYFLFTIKSGIANKSYGVHVARMAGLPSKVIVRASSILDGYEQTGLFKNGPQNNLMKNKKSISSRPLFSSSNYVADGYKKIMDILDKVSIDKTTPLEALSTLNKLKAVKRE